MIYCKIENGLVVNRTKFKNDTVPDGFPGTWVQSDTAQIDWAYDGQTFTPPPWDRSNSPSQWHGWIGDKETRIGDWVERTEDKTEYERKAAIQSGNTQFETVLSTWTVQEIVDFVDAAFTDQKQNAIVKGILKHMAART